MADPQKLKNALRRRRKLRSKKRFSGTGERPRLVIYKSLKHIYSQLVDDQAQRSIVGASSLAKELSSEKLTGKAIAEKVGELIAARARAKGVETVVFDRSGYRFHGQVKALADGARKAGLKF